MRVVVTGSNGLIGSALCQALTAKGDAVVRLVRGTGERGSNSWNLDSRRIDDEAIEGSDGVVHLAGAGIADHKWTPEHKKAVLETRIVGTTLMAETIAKLGRRPSVWVSGSAIGFYGDRGDETLDDEVRAIEHILGTPALCGPVNATSPQPVTNTEFTKALGAALHRPTFLPTPLFAVKAMFGAEMVREMLLASARVTPRKLLDSGFRFNHPDLAGALRLILENGA